MSSILLEIIFDAADFAKMSIEGRDEIEDSLDEALTEEDIGEITGGGTGSGVVMIDVEIESEEQLAKGLEVIRQVLYSLKCPESTFIRRAKPSERIYKIY